MINNQKSILEQYLQAANLAIENGAWAGAAELFAKAIPFDPSASLMIQYGHMLKESGFLDAAVRAYQAALIWDGTATDGYLHLGHLLKRLERAEEALHVFEAAEAIPYAPYVRAEINGLRVARLNAAHALRSGSEIHDTGSMPESLRAENEALHTWLKSETERRQKKSNHVRARSTAYNIFSLKRRIPSFLEPMADLVVEAGVYRATTNNPRMHLRSVDEAELSGIAGQWIEISVNIREVDCIVDPILFLEELPGWGKFQAIRLARGSGSSFSAITRLPSDIISLRIDPVRSPGKFIVSNLRLTRLSGISIFARLLADSNAPTIVALSREMWKGGFHAINAMVQKHFVSPLADQYARWIALRARRFGTSPIPMTGKCDLGFLVLLNNDTEMDYRTTLTSLREQDVSKWKLGIVLDDNVKVSVRQAIEREVAKDDRIKLILTNSDTTNAMRISAGAKMLDSEFIGILIAGDYLSSDAVSEFRNYARINPAAKAIYCDHDLIDDDGHRHSPCFKPDWNVDYIHSYNYVGSSVIFSRSCISAVGGWRDDYPGLEVFDVLLRIANETEQKGIGHLSMPLWHCRTDGKAQGIAGLVNDVFAGRKSKITAENGRVPNTAKLNWPVPIPLPHVTIIIPTRDRIELLENAVGSILCHTDYPSFDIIVVDNGSVDPESMRYFDAIIKTNRVSVLRDDGTFNFSRLNNRAAKIAKGTVLALVNNDVEVSDGRWLKEMVPIALDPEVGAVGAKLLYGSGHVQHAGIVGGVGMVAAHGHKYAEQNDAGYMNRLIVQQTTLAVTAACLVVEAHKYWAVDGLDEDRLTVAFNDVDLCLKLRERGWRSVLTPWAVLFHHESLSRGPDISGSRASRFKKEAEYMVSRWGDKILKDPFYSPNLSHTDEDFSLDLSPPIR